MGAYIDIDGLESRMKPEVVNDLCGRRLGTNKTTYLTNVITRAEDLINGYAGNLYQTPLPDSGIIEEWAYRIAEYEMYKNGPGNDIPVKYKDSYTEAMKQIQDMAVGKFIPPNGITRKTESGISVDFESDDAMFTYDNFSRF